MSLGSWDLPNMGDSIGDSIVTPYITNLLGKDPNRCQMTRMFCWPSTFVVSFYLFVDEAAYGYFVLLAVCSAICSAKFGFFLPGRTLNE
jgi:hypothetical protein